MMKVSVCNHTKLSTPLIPPICSNYVTYDPRNIPSHHFDRVVCNSDVVLWSVGAQSLRVWVWILYGDSVFFIYTTFVARRKERVFLFGKDFVVTSRSR